LNKEKLKTIKEISIRMNVDNILISSKLRKLNKYGFVEKFDNGLQTFWRRI